MVQTKHLEKEGVLIMSIINNENLLEITRLLNEIYDHMYLRKGKPVGDVVADGPEGEITIMLSGYGSYKESGIPEISTIVFSSTAIPISNIDADQHQYKSTTAMLAQVKRWHEAEMAREIPDV
jgi:hypothetical protein